MALPQPTLTTARLVLSRFEQTDLPHVFLYASDSEVAKSVTWPAHQNLEDSRAFLDWIAKSTSETEGKLFFVWAIRRKNDGHAIGSIDFKQPYPHIGQFDYALSATEWNQGIMTEAAKAVTRWAFEALPALQRFQAFCLADNWGSRRVMEKCGLSLECVRTKGMMLKDSIVDTAHYALVK